MKERIGFTVRPHPATLAMSGEVEFNRQNLVTSAVAPLPTNWTAFHRSSARDGLLQLSLGRRPALHFDAPHLLAINDANRVQINRVFAYCKEAATIAGMP